ncbi:MAG TPA: CoA transferase [Bradyrhizobium sp.]|jgi:crotonobetainyl-CoA:carnitine CoA-transferase CaiB-like acyl-CoA transferase|uniref:CaiB/BaiF CoA transferase family protein n=1 Tax=Bradyrhizobium sp. TaxID=376 RepID=UPI002CC2C5D0|nr:CoA transferase [Bradyrhizobium sp.]HXB79213.1 CoA transferase [Bradyrhizobium sp.]
MSKIFEGLKVIDCGSFIAAPTAATLLADFGADVIKIEPPGAGDAFRMVPKLPGMPQSHHPYGWLLDNRNKRGLALDLAKREGQAALHRLVANADVFITNYPLVVRRKLAIDHGQLALMNERLIYASFTGYGETGAEAGKPGFDVTAYWARSGLMDMVRSDANTPPARALAGMGDHPSGVSLFAAIAMALYQRERTGHGALVGSSLLANGIWSNGIMAQAALCGATFTPRPPREKLFNALGCYYRCRDGRWLLLAIVNEQRDFPVVAKCLGLDNLIDDPRFTKQTDRFARSAELIALFDEAFAKRDRDEWRVLLDEAGIVFECVAEMGDLSADRQLLDAGVLVPFENDAMLTIDSPFFVAGADKVKPRKAPAVGEHSNEILREAGYDEAAIAKLHQSRVVA